MLMADVTEIVFDAYDTDGEVEEMSLIVAGHQEGIEAVDMCRDAVRKSERLDEFIVILKVTHIHVPYAFLSSLPLLDFRKSDLEPVTIA